MNVRNLMMTLAVVAVLTATAPAQESGLTLDEALELAGTAHPALAAAAADVEVATAEAEQAGAWPNPAAFLKMEAAPRDGDAWNGSERIVGLSQALPWGGRTGAARAVAEAEAVRRQHEQTLTARSVEAQVRLAFAVALHARDNVALRETGLEIARKVRDLTQARIDAGDAPLLDLRRARMALGEAQTQLDAAEVAADVALGDLAAAMGVPLAQVPAVRGALENLPTVPELETLLADMESAPRNLIADATVQERSAMITAASRLRRPDLELEFGLRTSPEGDSFDAGVRIDLPVLDGGGARVKAARAGEAAAQYRERVLQQDLAAAVRRAHADLEVAVRSAETYEDVVVPEATAALTATETAYTEGAADITDVFQITRDWIAAQAVRLDLLLAAERARAELTDLL